MKRNYSQVDNQMRQSLVKMIVEDSMTIKNSSRVLGIKYENAKAIYRAFRLQNRVSKVKHRRPRQYQNPTTNQLKYAKASSHEVEEFSSEKKQQYEEEKVEEEDQIIQPIVETKMLEHQQSPQELFPLLVNGSNHSTNAQILHDKPNTKLFQIQTKQPSQSIPVSLSMQAQLDDEQFKPVWPTTELFNNLEYTVKPQLEQLDKNTVKSQFHTQISELNSEEEVDCSRGFYTQHSICEDNCLKHANFQSFLGLTSNQQKLFFKHIEIDKPTRLGFKVTLPPLQQELGDEQLSKEFIQDQRSVLVEDGLCLQTINLYQDSSIMKSKTRKLKNKIFCQALDSIKKTIDFGKLRTASMNQFKQGLTLEQKRRFKLREHYFNQGQVVPKLVSRANDLIEPQKRFLF